MGTRWSWRIEGTWDGREIPRSEHARVELEWVGEKIVIEITAPFHDDPPPPGSAGSHPGLWDFEVVELFLLGARERYLEIEVGPHGHYWMLEMEGPRQARRDGLPMDLRVRHEGDQWRARASVESEYLPEGWDRANAYAIHGVGEARRYLAAHPVPGAGPDFHRLACFPSVQSIPLGE